MTSPPYYGMRDYHVEGQLGLEDTPEAYTECLLQVFREVHRVLRDDGTLWLNIGDSYHGGGYSNHRINGQEWLKTYGGDRRRSRQADRIRANPDLKPKDLIGIPWRIAFALQAEGWWLRADIIWAKGSCLPESVTDRPTRVHEYVFLLTKAQSYYYDQEAIREPLAICNAQRTTETYDTAERYGADNGGNDGLDALAARIRSGEHLTRNKRSVWNINPKPFAGAHFAVMPTELAETCVKAGSKPGDLVLDPFAGSGTTLVVAKSLDRYYVGIELNPEYVEIARQRLIPVHEEADQRAFAREVEGVFIPGAQ